MNKLIKKFISYFFVGGIAAIVEWGTFALANHFVNYEIATIIAFIVATTANYFLGKYMTFKNNEHKKTDVIKVFIISGIGLLLNMLFMYLMIDKMHIPYQFICKIISTGLVFIWNFLSRILFVYKDKKEE